MTKNGIPARPTERIATWLPGWTEWRRLLSDREGAVKKLGTVAEKTIAPAAVAREFSDGLTARLACPPVLSVVARAAHRTASCRAPIDSDPGLTVDLLRLAIKDGDLVLADLCDLLAEKLRVVIADHAPLGTVGKHSACRTFAGKRVVDEHVLQTERRAIQTEIDDIDTRLAEHDADERQQQTCFVEWWKTFLRQYSHPVEPPDDTYNPAHYKKHDCRCLRGDDLGAFQQSPLKRYVGRAGDPDVREPSDLKATKEVYHTVFI
ncbi:MAG: hypothetical protein ACE5EX_12395 [Phycisphaerae bacterium]